MKRRMLPLALWSALAPPLRAQPAAPAARLRLVPERDARRLEVGEALVVRLEVWVSTWFQAPVPFPATLAAEGALVEEVGGSPDARFDDVGGRRWTGLVRRYRVLPAQPGELGLALPGPLQVQPGGGAPLRLAPPPPLRLTVRAPAGAEDIQPFVAARRLALSQRWSSDASLQVGDLLRREVLLVTDSSSPLLPAPDFGAPPGVRVHVPAAQVQEARAHAAATPTLTRRTGAVYTLERPGRVVLPSIELVWWDLARRQRRVTRLEGRTLDVRPAPALADPFALPASAATAVPGPAAADRAPRVAALAATLAATLAAGALATLAWRRRAGRGAEGPAVDAPRAWRRLRRACRGGDASAADVALHATLATLEPAMRQAWLRDAALCAALTELGRRRFGPAATPAAGWHGAALWEALQRLRRAAREASASPALPALHP